MNFSKDRVINAFEEHLLSKKKSLEIELIKIRADAASETKSSMGDKYEIGREMLRQEESKLMNQKRIVEDLLLALKRIDGTKSMDTVETGALVQTNAGFFLVGAGLGKIRIGAETVFGISPLAPLAQQLLGKKEGDKVKMNASYYQIMKVN